MSMMDEIMAGRADRDKVHEALRAQVLVRAVVQMHPRSTRSIADVATLGESGCPVACAHLGPGPRVDVFAVTGAGDRPAARDAQRSTFPVSANVRGLLSSHGFVSREGASYLLRVDGEAERVEAAVVIKAWSLAVLDGVKALSPSRAIQ